MRLIVIAVAIAAASFLHAQGAVPPPADAAKPAPEPANPPAEAAKPTAGGAADAGRTETGTKAMVTNVRVAARSKQEKFLESKGDNVVQLGDDVLINVSQWETVRAAARAAQKPVTLYINGRDSDLQPVAVSGDDAPAELTYRLERNDGNKDLWRDVLRDPTEEKKTLHLSVGVGGSADPLPLAPNAPNGSVILDKITLAGVGIFWLVVIAVLGGGLLYFSVTTDILRNGPKKDDKAQPFSLARTQMAWWFMLLIVAYILIWVFTGDRDTIPASLLALLGISAATAMGSAVIDTNKEQRNAAVTENLQAQKEKLDATVPAADAARPAVDQRIAAIDSTIASRNQPKQKSSFIMDLLTDDNGQIAIHRYQIAGWTIVLGIIFIATVIRDLSMPEFKTTLLALMGLSSGTYLGFKFPS